MIPGAAPRLTFPMRAMPLSDPRRPRSIPAQAGLGPRLRTPAEPRHNGPAKVDLGPLENHLGYYIRRAQVWVFKDFIRALADIDIRPAQYSVLVVIAANPGLSQSDLAGALGIERARLVRLLDRLERRGLTQRLPSPKDRRSHALQLTAQGQKVLKRAQALAAQHEARLAEKIGTEPRRMMIGLLRDFSR
jgi:DNA-binding MarR family transcriptional regulator